MPVETWVIFILSIIFILIIAFTNVYKYSIITIIILYTILSSFLSYVANNEKKQIEGFKKDHIVIDKSDKVFNMIIDSHYVRKTYMVYDTFYKKSPIMIGTKVDLSDDSVTYFIEYPIR